MRLSFLVIVIGASMASCASQKKSSTNSGNANPNATVKPNKSAAIGNTRTKDVVFLNDKTYLLTESTDDKTYGYTQQNPIKVGGVGGGPTNEIRFLNALLGPNGEEVTYERMGSCCAFKTPNGLIDDTALLDRYGVTHQGLQEKIILYLNMYDAGDLKIPVGFTAKK